jgi:hypothetical protein
MAIEYRLCAELGTPMRHGWAFLATVDQAARGQSGRLLYAYHIGEGAAYSLAAIESVLACVEAIHFADEDELEQFISRQMGEVGVSILLPLVIDTYPAGFYWPQQYQGLGK